MPETAVIGLIPAYTILDTSLNNLANTAYFTRRATGYPGPGILPSDERSLYVTLQIKW